LSLAAYIAMAGVALGGALAALGFPLEGGATAVLGFSLVYVRMDRTLTPALLFGPSSYAYLWHALGYSIGPLAQRYILGEERFFEEGMIRAQWGAVLGLATYAFVYPKVFRAVVCRMGNGKGKGRNEPPAGHKWDGYSVLLLAVSVLILFYDYVKSSGGRFSGSVADVSSLTVTIISSFWYAQIIVFLFLGFLAVKRRGWWIALAATAYVAYAVFQTLEGSRGPLVTSLLMLATGAVLAGYSRKKAFLALGLSAFLFIPLAGIVDYYRSTTRYSTYEEGFLGRISAFSEAIQGLRTVEAEGSQIANRAFIYAISAITVDRVMVMTPDVIPYAGFSGLDAILYIYVPSIIYPDRPEISDGNIIAGVYGMGEGTKSVFYYTPAVGEGYRRFGWVGIPLLYGLSGIIFGAAIAICWTRRQKREWAAMLAFFLLEGPNIWAFTFNYMAYFILFYVPKYYVYFAVLGKLQDVAASFHKTILRPRLVRCSAAPSLQRGSS